METTTTASAQLPANIEQLADDSITGTDEQQLEHNSASDADEEYVPRLRGGGGNGISHTTPWIETGKLALICSTDIDNANDTTSAAGTTDAETTDAETTDAETTDAETTDAETTDAETTDAETTDADATGGKVSIDRSGSTQTKGSSAAQWSASEDAALMAMKEGGETCE